MIAQAIETGRTPISPFIISETSTQKRDRLSSGIRYLCSAMALRVADGTWASDDFRIPGLLTTMMPALREYLSAIKLVGWGSITNGHWYDGYNDTQWAYAPNWKLYVPLKTEFENVLHDVSRSSEQMKQMEIVTVAGHQGSGKGKVAELLGKYGYSVANLSSIVRAITSVLEMNPNQTQDKINVGRDMKLLFQSDILVKLAMLDAIKTNRTRMISDGPRLKEEVVPGSKLIFITTDPDPEKDKAIRLQRITDRAAVEPARSADVVNFTKREEQEWQHIEDIRRRPGAILLINNTPTVDKFLENTRARLMQERIIS